MKIDDVPDQSGYPVIFAHVFYQDVWDEIVLRLETLPIPYRLVLTAPIGVLPARVPSNVIDIESFVFPNRGRDVLPFIEALRKTKFSFDLGLKIHTKKSVHREDGSTWGREIIGSLIGSPENVQQIVETMARRPDLGMCGPDGHYVKVRQFEGTNSTNLKGLLADLHVDRPNPRSARFIAGSMFWFKRQALIGLLESDLAKFDEERGQLDGTLAHAYERAFSVLAKSRGFDSSTVTEILSPFGSSRAARRQISAHLLPPPSWGGRAPYIDHAVTALTKVPPLRAAFRRLPKSAQSQIRLIVLGRR